MRGDEEVVGDMRGKDVFQQDFVDGRHRFHLFLFHSELPAPDEVQLRRDLDLTPQPRSPDMQNVLTYFYFMNVSIIKAKF